jgi:hypothetical protein
MMRVRRDEAGSAAWLVAGLILLAGGASFVSVLMGEALSDDRKRLAAAAEAARGEPLQRASSEPALKEIFIGPAFKQTDNSDVIDCKTRIAANRGMTWSGGKTGWRTNADPQPSNTSDGPNVLEARTKAWEDRMHGIMKAVQNDWLVDCQPSTPTSSRSAVNTTPLIPGKYSFQFGASTTCGGRPDSAMTIKSDNQYPPTALQVIYVVTPDNPAESTIVFSGTVTESWDFTATFMLPTESSALLPGATPNQSGGQMTLRGTFDVHDGNTIIKQGVLEIDALVLDKPVKCSFPYGATRTAPLG